MKKNFHAACILLLFVLTGCSIDDADKKPSVYSNNLVLGASARDFLSDETFTRIELDVVYVMGHKPEDQVLQSLTNFLKRYTHKPGGISLKTRAIVSPQMGSYSIKEIKTVEKQHRSVFSEDDKLGVFIFFADNKSEDSKANFRILGKAYLNTSLVIFDNQELSDMAGSASQSEIQTVTLHHEFGHLFGLVNNGSPAQSEHEDPDKGSRAHCSVEGCLMAAAIEFSSSPLSFLENDQNILDFDEQCKLDLKANGGK
ncbi:hypothetical protein VS868_03130 [Salinimicrobium sp. 3283s]|uniref:hypothetical protein n=1 Tax=Salinimicrobium sp. 3283s TaxID=3114359 RepID=UPI0031EAC4C1